MGWTAESRVLHLLFGQNTAKHSKTVARGISNVIPLATTWWRWSSDCLYLPPSFFLSGGDKHQLHQGSGLHDVGGGLRLRPQNHGGDRGLPWRWQLCHGETLDTLKVQVMYICTVCPDGILNLVSRSVSSAAEPSTPISCSCGPMPECHWPPRAAPPLCCPLVASMRATWRRCWRSRAQPSSPQPASGMMESFYLRTPER